MHSHPGFPLLTVLVLFPAVGALAVALVPRGRPEVVRTMGLVGCVAVPMVLVYAVAARPVLRRPRNCVGTRISRTRSAPR